MGPVSNLQKNTAATEEDSQHCTEPVTDFRNLKRANSSKRPLEKFKCLSPGSTTKKWTSKCPNGGWTADIYYKLPMLRHESKLCQNIWPNPASLLCK